MKVEISQILVQLSKFDLILLEEDINILINLQKLLKPFNTWTKEFSQENKITLSSVLPMYSNLSSHLQSINNNDFTSIQTLKNKILNELNSRFQNLPDIYLVATYLDPRYKKFLFIQNENKQNQLLIQAQNKLQNILPLNNNNLGTIENSTSRLSKLLTKYVVNNQSNTFFEIYNSFSEITYTQDPLLWWKSNENQFEKIHINFIKSILSIPAASASVERIFNMTGTIARKQRSALTPTHLSQLIFCKINKFYKICY